MKFTEQANKAADAFFIDDDPNNVAVGQKAGIPSAVYKPEVAISDLISS